MLIVGVDYITTHDFIRGWEVMEERTLPFVTNSLFETISYIERLLQLNNELNETQDSQTMRIMEVIIKNELLNKIVLCNRARSNLTEVHHAYKTGEPLLTYKYTEDRRYDMSYICLDLLRHDPKTQEKYFSHLMKLITMIVNGSNMLLSVIYTYSMSGQVNMTQYNQAQSTFIKGCKGYNYRLFQYRDRIVNKPLEIIKEKQDKFKSLKEILERQHHDLLVVTDHVDILTVDIKKTVWPDIKQAAHALKHYLQNKNESKTKLAHLFMSKKMDDNLLKINTFFSNLRSRSRDLSDSWARMSNAYAKIYVNMLNEISTKAPYQMLLNDLEDMMKYPNTTDTYMRYFAHILKTNISQIRDTDPEDFYFLLNADLPITKEQTKRLAIHHFFHGLGIDTGISHMIGNGDEVFTKATNRVVKSLQNFADGNQVNFDFYR